MKEKWNKSEIFCENNRINRKSNERTIDVKTGLHRHAAYCSPRRRQLCLPPETLIWNYRLGHPLVAPADYGVPLFEVDG